MFELHRKLWRTRKASICLPGERGIYLKEEVKALEEHPVEAGEVEEVGEGEGGAEEGLGELGGDQVLPREGEDPVERRQAEGAEQPHVDLVT